MVGAAGPLVGPVRAAGPLVLVRTGGAPLGRLGADRPLVGLGPYLRRTGGAAGPARASPVTVAGRLVAYVSADLAARVHPGRYRRVGGARTGYPALALSLLDRGDQLALAHPSGPGDAERGSHALQFGEQHRGQAAARAPAPGRAGRLLRRRDAGNIRRHVGGVAQWIPSLGGSEGPGSHLVAGRPPVHPLHRPGTADGLG